MTSQALSQPHSETRSVARIAALVVALLAPGAWSGVASASTPAQPAAETPVSYATLSDADLTQMGTRWETLTAEERRALLQEVKQRMARDRSRQGGLKIRTTRQYGVVRKADGTTVRVERQIVRVVPANPNRAGRVTFGMGFERRQQPQAVQESADRVQQPPDASAVRQAKTQPK